MARKRVREIAVDGTEESAAAADPVNASSRSADDTIGSAAKPRKVKRQQKSTTDAVDDAAALTENAATEVEPRYPSVVRRTTHTKKKVLVVCSRGVTSTNVELMDDLLKLLPHGRKDPKFDKGEPLSTLGEIADLNACAGIMYFEARKMKDLYLWVCANKTAAKTAGPCAKFLVEKVRPMRDLRLTGNCLLGSRTILSFDGSFERTAHAKVLKQLLAHIFAPPKGHPRSKPFHDHVLSFSWLDGRVVVRHYQVVPPLRDKKKEDDTLVEIGPRLTLVPIRILEGVFAGETIYSSESFKSPNLLRSEQKRRAAKRTIGHVAQKERRRDRIAQGGDAMPEDELADVFHA